MLHEREPCEMCFGTSSLHSKCFSASQPFRFASGSHVFADSCSRPKHADEQGHTHWYGTKHVNASTDGSEHDRPLRPLHQVLAARATALLALLTTHRQGCLIHGRTEASRMHASERASELASDRACMRASESANVLACVRASVRSMHASERACVRV